MFSVALFPPILLPKGVNVSPASSLIDTLYLMFVWESARSTELFHEKFTIPVSDGLEMMVVPFGNVTFAIVVFTIDVFDPLNIRLIVAHRSLIVTVTFTMSPPEKLP